MTDAKQDTNADALDLISELFHTALFVETSAGEFETTNIGLRAAEMLRAALAGTVQPVAVAVKGQETQDNGIATVCDGTRFRDSAEADGQASGEAGLLRPTEGSIPSYLASIGHLEASRDLLDAFDRDFRTVGYRADMWECLRSAVAPAALAVPGDVVERGALLVMQLRSVMHKLDGQAYSSTLSALNHFEAALSGQSSLLADKGQK